MAIKADIVMPCGDNSSRNGKAIRAGIIHTAEGATDEVNLGHYFENTPLKVSSHWGIGQDGGLAQYVSESMAAWTCGKGNSTSVQVELCLFARCNREQWLKYPKLLNTTARLFAHWNQTYGIELVHGSVSDYRKGRKALYDHHDINVALAPNGTHTDVGLRFPWDVVLSQAKMLIHVVPASKSVKPSYATLIYKNRMNFSHKSGVRQTGIKRLQTILRDKRLYKGKIDGDFGPMTERSTKAFQSASHLKNDGVWGPKTWAKSGY